MPKNDEEKGITVSATEFPHIVPHLQTCPRCGQVWECRVLYCVRLSARDARCLKCYVLDQQQDF